MSKKWYALAALGSFAFGGITCGSGGYLYGYYKSEPEVLIKDLNQDGNDDFCVLMNEYEAWCAMDYNEDGAGDIVEIDLVTSETKRVSYGKNPCLVKSLDEFLENPPPPPPTEL